MTGFIYLRSTQFGYFQILCKFAKKQLTLNSVGFASTKACLPIHRYEPIPIVFAGLEETGPRKNSGGVGSKYWWPGWVGLCRTKDSSREGGCSFRKDLSS